MKVKRLVLTATAMAAASALAFFLFFIEPERLAVLDIRSSDGRILGEIELPDGRFDHVFIHSIHLTPVVECFRMEKGGPGRATLHLFELQYQSSGVGMPSDAEDGYRLENGVFILAMNRDFQAIPVMVSIVAGHGISAGGIFYPFSATAKAEDRILLTGRFVQRLKFKRYALCAIQERKI
jgi:hypothetical protein